MWSYVKIPYVDPVGNSGVVCLERYLVSEGDVIHRGDRIAIAHADERSFLIVSNYAGKILKLILPPNTMVAFRDPIATLELLQDPVDGMLIERCELIDIV